MGKEPQDLQPDMPYCEAAGPVIAAKLDDLFQHEHGTRAGEDIEALHDMRVASRRLRAAMDVFAPCFPSRAFKPLQKTAARLTKALGAVRDLDVLLENLAKSRQAVSAEEQIGLDDLTASLRDERDAHREQMIATLEDVDRSGFRHQLHALARADHAEPRKRAEPSVDTTLSRNAQRIGVERVGDLYSFAPAIHDPDRAEELHEMRIAAKHLRYALEIFEGCYGEDIEERIKEIKAIQEQIGQIHDHDVLADLLRQHLSVLAQRMHADLAGIAAEPLSRDERMARLRTAIASYAAADPRIGLLALFGRTLEKRRRRYADFVHWWDERERDGMRDTLFACITAGQRQEASQ